MKVEQIKETFTPIKLEITIETEAELWNLYHRINEAPGVINKRPNLEGNKADNSARPLYEQLDKIRKELLKKK